MNTPTVVVGPLTHASAVWTIVTKGNSFTYFFFSIKSGIHTYHLLDNSASPSTPMTAKWPTSLIRDCFLKTKNKNNGDLVWLLLKHSLVKSYIMTKKLWSCWPVCGCCLCWELFHGKITKVCRKYEYLLE